MTNLAITQLLPVLVHIQTHLDEDLSLDRLARLAGLSRYTAPPSTASPG